jgi:hypothetical protein
MNSSEKLSAAFGYVPVLGWLYVLLAASRNKFAIFHLRQGVGLILFLALISLAWAALTWLLSWLSFGFLIGNALFALVISAFTFAIFAMISGMRNAAQGKPSVLPIFGRRSLQLPIGNL